MQTYRRKKIETTCNQLWSDCSLGPGFDIAELLSRLKINLSFEDFTDDISAILVTKGNTNLISLNQNNNINRQRFSACHELGHLFLEHKKNLDVNGKELIQYRNTMSSQGLDTDEIEANFFAATLLMPAMEIARVVDYTKSFDATVDFVSEKFKVSYAAATLRLSYLGYQ